MDNSVFLEQLLSHKDNRCRTLASGNVEQVAKMTCCLLNGEGGWIVVGVDERGDVCGVGDVTEECKKIQGEISQAINPFSLVYISAEKVDDNEVVLLTVLKGMTPPYAYKCRYYVEIDGKISTPSDNDVSVMLRQQPEVRSAWERREILGAEMEELDRELVAKVRTQAVESMRLNSSMGDDEINFLSGLELINWEHVTNGAMALFGKNTKKFLPQCSVKIQVMLEGKTADTYEDVRVLEGNIIVLHDKLKQYFEEMLPRVARFSDSVWTRQEDLLYPMAVLDEMVTNALIHSDYHNRYDCIDINIYADRIECKNAGSIDEDILKHIRRETHLSSLRNPIMANVYYMYGLMEKSGRGISLMRQRMAAMGRKLPEWESHGGYTIVTLYAGNAELNDRIKMFCNRHKIGYSFSRSEYQAAVNVSEVTAKKDLQLMQDFMVCQPKGKGKLTQYVLYRNFTE
ncbi:MAG: putative DNA binding domain-containing protein [Bacteroidales bacterium]|nr:putative DNA binding domain-containing protein [Bacteroidales bacterium]